MLAHHHRAFGALRGLRRVSSSTAPQFVPPRLSSAGGASRNATAAAPFAVRPLGYINGAWVPAADGRTLEVRSPCDGTLVARVPDMGAEDTRAAIDAASRAFPAWAATPAWERCAVVARLHALVSAHAEGLAVLVSLEAGKPYAEALGEVRYAADFLQWYAEEGRRPSGELLAAKTHDRKLITSAQPVGPCALLTPWNFPAASALGREGGGVDGSCSSYCSARVCGVMCCCERAASVLQACCAALAFTPHPSSSQW